VTEVLRAISNSARIQFLALDLTQVEVPTEWTPALVEVLAPANAWSEVQLFIQDRSVDVYLRNAGGQPRLLADWQRSGPGHYRLRLEVGSETEVLVATVAPRKISAAAFHTLLDDLEHRLPAAAAIALQRLGGLAGLRLRPPQQSTRAQELQRLRRTIRGSSRRPGLIKILGDLGGDPHRLLHASEPWVPAERARRPHPARLVQALSRGGNLSDRGLPQQVLDTRVVHSFDVYENRLVRAFHDDVKLHLRRLVDVLHAEVASHPSSWVTPPETWQPLAEARQLRRDLRRARLHAEFLDEVSPAMHQPLQLTMVLTRRPAYRSALEAYLEFHRSVWLRLEEPALETPLEELPYLYQLWATLTLLQELQEFAESVGFRVEQQRLVHKDASGYFVRIVPDGQSLITLAHPSTGVRVRFVPERTYRRDAAGLHSISFDQRPDVTLEVVRASGGVTLFLFDPKYKLDSENAADGNPDGSPLKVDIDKMHAYRDSIRGHHGERVTCYATIMYPGTFRRFPAHGSAIGEVEALRAYPGEAFALSEGLREALVDACNAGAS
jgi:hypothetical protein